MKIWQLLDSYFPDYGGGAALAAQGICRALAEQGHEVRVLCTETAEAPPYSVRTDWDGTVRVDRINLPYFRDNDPEGWLLGWESWRAHERRVDQLLRQLASDWRPEIVHYHVMRPLGEQCLFTLSELGLPVVATLHDAWLICPRMYLLRSPNSTQCSGPTPLRCLECMYSHYDGGRLQAAAKLPWRVTKLGTLPAYRLWRRRSAQKLLSGTMACANWLMEAHRSHVPGAHACIPLGIDPPKRPVSRPHRPRSPLRFGFVGGLQPHKGLSHVLQACGSLKRRGLEFELHLWGPGATVDAALPEELRDCLTLHGMYESDEKWSVYEQVDVLLMATIVVEMYGLVVQEARAAGAPTIAPEVGGLAEQIRHGVDGLLYRFRDAEDLERQMHRVLTEPELLARMLESQPQPVSRTAAVTEIEGFYRQVMDAKGA
ncbi:MAG: glycosyltransferase [Actinomycetota bacterium]